ncbi:hypothetical protein ACFPRL_11080 [Pseudoclavibacter helvolus]
MDNECGLAFRVLQLGPGLVCGGRRAGVDALIVEDGEDGLRAVRASGVDAQVRRIGVCDASRDQGARHRHGDGPGRDQQPRPYASEPFSEGGGGALGDRHEARPASGVSAAGLAASRAASTPRRCCQSSSDAPSPR